LWIKDQAAREEAIKKHYAAKHEELMIAKRSLIDIAGSSTKKLVNYDHIGNSQLVTTLQGNVSNMKKTIAVKKYFHSQSLKLNADLRKELKPPPLKPIVIPTNPIYLYELPRSTLKKWLNKPNPLDEFERYNKKENSKKTAGEPIHSVGAYKILSDENLRNEFKSKIKIRNSDLALVYGELFFEESRS